MSRKSNQSGCTINIAAGNIIAVIISAAMNHSIGWGVFHFLCGWFYVLYAVCFRTKEIIPAIRAMFM